VKHHHIIAVLLALLLVSCSTQKNTFVNRNYHNLTAYYNVYFNGNEAMKMGLNKVETRVEEDYTKILPIFKESMAGTESMVSSDMATAIEKGEKLIKLHSITKPPKSDRNKSSRNRKPKKEDYNKWVDDAYIMIGRGHFYKKDFIRSSSIFTQIIRKFKDEPIKYEAYLWLIRSYNESERYTESRELIESLEGDNNFPDELEGDLAINTADLHLKQRHFDEAIQYLNIGIKKIKGNKRKTRYSFILAQIYQETGKNDQALEAYHQVIRRRPDYKMLFNARINSAGVFSGKGNISDLRKELMKMSKKQRNQDFLDQIYFALGNLSINEGKTNEAIELYKKSASKSTKNTFQRALSCLTLGEIYFDQKKYIPSGNYYDSAMVVIDENYPNYPAISDKYKNLSNLVSNLQMVVTQDSLQALAKLTPGELNSKIDNWIVEATKKMSQDEEEGAGLDAYASSYGYNNNSRMKLGNSSNSWYFYNPSTVSYGKKEFTRLWGQRKNEDNWRRKDKSISNLDENGEPAEGSLAENIDSLETIRIDDPTTREFYTQDIPTTDSLMNASHDKIRDALYNAGNVLKTEFNDNENAIMCFRELNKRYPNNIYDLPSYFGLWDLYTSMSRADSTGYYRNLIVEKYPESNYAKYLMNPNYFVEEAARKDSLNSLYSKAFTAYKQNDFSSAAKYCDMVINLKPDSALTTKVEFIKTVATAKGQDKQRFSSALQDYVQKYPKAEPTPLAQQIIELLKADKLSNYSELVNTGYLNEVIKNLELLPQSQQTENQEASSKWDKASDLLHYFVIAIPNNDEIDVNRLKFDIANYNIDNYTTLDYDIETENLNNDTKLIVVRSFEDKENALVYFLSIIRKPLVFKTLAGIQFLNFVISNNNYREMLSERSYNNYLPYFVKNYSSFTGKAFQDSDFDSPEMLMAKLKQDENETLVERGEYVEVKTSDANYVPPVQQEQFFKLNYAEVHSCLLIVNEPRYKTGLIMRDFVQFNNTEYKTLRLKVVPFNFKDKTALIISQFGNGYEAAEYLKKIESNKKLFSSLGSSSYTCNVVSSENLNKLKETNNFDEWAKFYKANYIQRRPPAPVKAPEVKPEVQQPKAEVKAQPAEETKSKVEANSQPSQANVETKVTEPTVVVAKPAEPKVENVETKTENVVAANKTTVEPVKESYSGLYVSAPDSAQLLIYILPSSGSNKTLLSTYLNRLNAMKYRDKALTVTTEEFNEYQSMVIVRTFENNQVAKQYATDINSDNRIAMSLRNVNYRSYIITKTNLQLLKSSKNIQEYQKFYDSGQ